MIMDGDTAMNVHNINDVADGMKEEDISLKRKFNDVVRSAAINDSDASVSVSTSTATTTTTAAAAAATATATDDDGNVVIKRKLNEKEEVEYLKIIDISKAEANTEINGSDNEFEDDINDYINDIMCTITTDKKEHDKKDSIKDTSIDHKYHCNKVENTAMAVDSMGLLMGSAWNDAIGSEFKKPYFKKLSALVALDRKNGIVHPPASEVLAWSLVCSPADVRVCIIGQDPYHGPGQAHGLCFSVKRGVPPPPSLINMYKELTTDCENFKAPSHGFLESWSSQGVLLLNSVLTVKESQANSHANKGWEQFTDAIIAYLSARHNDIVFILWGSYAKKKGSKINRKRHLVIDGVHPSPLSVYRGFYGSKPFSRANAYLKSKGRTPVDWTSICQ